MRKLKKLLIWPMLLLLGLYVYDDVLINRVPAREKSSDVRIGYINLHESKISGKDLERMKTYDCDIWLFLEWNGNNLDNDSSLLSGYYKLHETIDEGTFGTAIFSKWDKAEVKETGKQDRPYACDYPKYMFSHAKLNILLLHAPPPVPDCDFETGEYLADALRVLDTAGYKGQLVVGDFNSLPFQSGVTSILELGFEDSHDACSNWPQGTFAPFTWLPKLIKFDYVLHNRKLQPVQASRFSISSSDHSGWIADYTIRH